MTTRNKNYDVLYTLNISSEEIEKRKARFRELRSRYKKLGYTEASAVEIALKSLVDRESEALVIPSPPEGSGLEVRGQPDAINGGIPYHWSFTIYDTTVKDENGVPGKKRRIKYIEIPSSIVDLFPEGIEETIELKQRIEEQMGGFKARLERQIAWIKENKVHHELALKFIEKEAKIKNNKRARGSASKTALYNFVLPFFLKKYFLPDVRQWYLYYDEFREWLNEHQPLRNFAKGEKLRNNTQSNYISVLNKYVEFVHKQGKFAEQPLKCPNYKRSELERRGIEAIILKEEEEAFFKMNQERRFEVAAFISIGNHTAMRPTELLGLTIRSVKKRDYYMENSKSRMTEGMRDLIMKVETTYQKTVYGFLELQSQPKLASIRDEAGKIPRAPLKSRDEISPKFYRRIPIVDRDIWKLVTTLLSRQRKPYEEKRWGDDQDNYLLFDGLTLTEVETYFRDFRNKSKWGHLNHVPYCTRHTGCTYWVSLTRGDSLVSKHILGHRDTRETEYYDHLSELFESEMQKRAESKSADDFFEQFNDDNDQ